MSSPLAKLRIATISENAIQFYVPLYRHIVADGRLDLQVLFLTDRGERPFKVGGATVKHERSMLEGYPWKRMSNWSPFQNTFGFFDNFDPQLYTELTRGGYDAAWFDGYAYASMWLGFATCMRAGIPLILRGESESFFPRSRFRNLAKHAILEPLFRRMDAFLYIGQCNREFYEEFGVPSKKLFYMPYGIDNSMFQATPELKDRWRQDVRAELGLGANTCVFIYTSKHRNPKRPGDAVAAFCALPPELDIALIMLGDGDLRPEAERIFRDRGRGHRVFFLGSRLYSQLPQMLAAADVFVFTSIENWGMAINEALAAGLAVITSDQVAGWLNMVSPGVNGFIFRAGFIQALTAHMITLAVNRHLVESMKHASLERARTFGFSQMTDGLVRAVQYAARQPQTAAGVQRRR